jgi:hypothetical protein
MSEKKDKVIAVLDKETKAKLDYICKRDKRAMSNMMAFLIDYYYRQVVKENDNDKVIGRNPTPEDYDEFLKLKGIGWSGNLEEMRKGRVFDNGSN